MASFKKVRTIAEGGMGRVDLVLRRSGKFRRLFALKRPHAHLLKIPTFEEMFFDEANLAGLIHHPNVISVVEVGRDREGPFMLMEYVEGITAAQLIERARRDDEWIAQSVAVDVARQAAEGLASIHGLRSHDGRLLQVVHRDISPQNLLIGFDGNVRISDMGIAKSLESTTQTNTGLLKGKSGYMSPEQLRFEPVDFRSDLFALGVVLFELLAGERLYAEADARKTASRILHSPPPDIYDFRADIHEGIAELLFELLAKTAEARPASADDVAQRLGTIQQQLQVFDEDTPTLRALVQRYFSPEFESQHNEVQTWTNAEHGSERTKPRLLLGLAAVASATLGLGVLGANWLTKGERATEPVLRDTGTEPLVTSRLFEPKSLAAGGGDAGPPVSARDASVHLQNAPPSEKTEMTRTRRRNRKSKRREAQDTGKAQVDRPGWDWND